MAQLNQGKDALQVFDEVLQREIDTKDAVFNPPVATALMNKGNVLRSLGSEAEARQLFEEVVRRYGASTDRTLQDSVAAAKSALNQDPPQAAPSKS